MRKYRFGEFELDLDAVRLRKNGEPVRLERRPLDLLILLASRQGELVKREEIAAALWPPGSVIEFETGINTLVRKVRGALGESSDQPRFIETVPARGYRFVAPETMALSAVGREAESTAPANPGRPRSRRRVAAVVASIALLGVAVFAAAFFGRTSPEAEGLRIAVLPFENLTGDEALGYLASGLAEETSRVLAQIDVPNLSIVGSRSASAAASSSASLEEMGRLLDADLLVVSTLRSDGSNLRLTPQLLRVADSEQIWVDSFDRAQTGTLGLERELAIAIAEQVRQRLSPEVTAAIDRRQTLSPAAWDLYLAGRHAWNQGSRGSVREALAFFERAVDADPTYALAWAGIAHTLITSPMTSGTNLVVDAPRAQEALEKALHYGPDLAEVYYALGYFRNLVEWDVIGAERAARRAVELDQNNAIARMFLGMLLSQQGRYTDALASLKRARELEPMFALAFANSALVASLSGDSNLALELARHGVAMGEDVWATHFQLGNVQLRLGRHAEALSSFEAAERLSGGNSLAPSIILALAGLGRKDEARTQLERLHSMAADEYVPPLDFARAYAALGDTDAAFAWIERAIANRSVGIRSIHHGLGYETLYSDPRFAEVLRRRQQLTRHLIAPECEIGC